MKRIKKVKMNIKKAISIAMLGAFTFSVPMVTTDAKRVHDPEVETNVHMNRASDNHSKTVNLTPGKITDEDQLEYTSSSQDIIEAVWNSRQREAQLRNQYENQSYDSQASYDSQYEYDVQDTPNVEVPITTSTNDTSIMGTPIATQRQCVRYLLRNNPNPDIAVSAEEIVAYYYEEGEREGIRPDVAFMQALKETGFFRYGGDVVPEQNNYCGLGTTGGGVRGTYFSTPQIGVRAHIQHLLAYTSTRKPTLPIVDPRYSLVRQAYGSRTLSTWQDLNGRWAVPGYYYGQDIMSMFKAMLSQ